MEDDQQFCLRWNNHQSTLIQNFDTLLESGTLVDCTLAAEGKTLKAHKVVLSACSPYFECLLSEHYDKHPVFILKDVKFKELKAMMDYMYRGEVNISQDQLAALLKAAESLQIKGLSESKTAGSSKAESRSQKTVSQPIARVSPSLDIPHASSGLTIEKNKVPRQSVAQGPVGDIPEDTASPQGPKRLCSREGSQSPTSRKRNRFRRRSLGEDNNTLEMQDASNSSDMPQQMGVPALGIAPVTDEKVHTDSIDSLGRSALMTQLTKPADEILQPLEKSETNDNLIEPKSEYLEESEECVEDLTLDDDMNDLNDEQDNNRAGPSHDPAQHPAGLGAWHVTGDQSNAGGVVSSLRGGGTDEVFLAAQEAAQQAQRDSQELELVVNSRGEGIKRKYSCKYCGKGFTQSGHLRSHQKSSCYWNPRSTCHQSQKIRPYSCTQCGACYSKQSHLIFHVRHECGRTQKCNVCGKTFLHSSSLRRHQQGRSFVRKKRPRKEDEVLSEREKKDVCITNKRSNLTNGKVATPGPATLDPATPGPATVDPAMPSTSTGRGRPKVSEVISLSDSQNESSDNDNSSPWTNSKNIVRKKPKCPYCGIMYEKRHHLIKHVTFTCISNPDSKANKEAGKFRCVDCGRNYAEAKTLRYHQKHECQQTITCPDCGRTMRGSYITERHKQKHCVKKHWAKKQQRPKIKQEVESPDELFIDDSSIEF